jgi:hypothetical protein
MASKLDLCISSSVPPFRVGLDLISVELVESIPFRQFEILV